ncbi:MAG: hypothetical protein COW63_06805, partial [Bacteroidetes bacterium CG18_big_fil_WC_8_21_14_2_50_41_14]
MKKLILIQLILIFLIPLRAQTQENIFYTPDPNGKKILTVSARQMPANQSLPLEYDASNTRMVATMPSPMNETGDTLLPVNTGQRWSTTFGSHNHYDEVYDLLEDYDKGYYIVGWDAIANGNGKGWDIKTDINGTLLYDKRLVYTGVRVGVAACQDSIGNKYIAGIDFGEIAWPFLIKFNPCGEKAWCSLLKHWDFLLGSPSDIIINDEGNIIVLTRFEDGNQQINQIFLLCYSPDGELLWSKPYASKTEHPLIAFSYGTKLYHFGEDYIISGYCYYPYPDNPNHVWLRPFFIGIDGLFNEKWILPFGVTDSVVGQAYSAIPLNDSVIMGVGSKFRDYPNASIRNSLMMFINHEGQELGYKRIWGDSIIPGTMDNLMVEIESVDDSIFLATAVIGPLTTGNPFGEIVFDTSGHVYRAQSRPNTRGMSNMIKTFDGKYVIACTVNENDMNHTDIYMYKINANLEQDTLYTQNFVYDSLCPGPIVSGDIDMTNCTVVQVSIDEAPTPEEYYKSLGAIPVKAYPNPADEF